MSLGAARLVKWVVEDPLSITAYFVNNETIQHANR